MKYISLLAFIFIFSNAYAKNDKPLTTDLSRPNISIAPPKNIIMVIADGMGPAYVSAYRYLNDNPTTEVVEETILDRTLVGMSRTSPIKSSGVVTDSAAAATALSTGNKTSHGTIAMNVHKEPMETVLEYAKKQGKKTGIVVTSEITHATPASYLSHNSSRHNYQAIADSYLENSANIDLLLGGGWQHFIRDDRHLVNEFKEKDFYYLDSYAQLMTLSQKKQQKKVIGLFADLGLPQAIDDELPNRLGLFTKAAIKQLENDNGFFLLIEASQIDWAGHNNDISYAMTEMSDLTSSIDFLEQYVASSPETLVIITADHSTGGLTLGANKAYRWSPETLHSMKHSVSYIAKFLTNQEITKQLCHSLFNRELSDKQISQLQKAKRQAVENLNAHRQLPLAAQSTLKPPNIKRTIEKSIYKLINKETNTGWTTAGHTGTDVTVHAMGKHKMLFSGHQDNTDIAKKIFKLLTVNDTPD